MQRKALDSSIIIFSEKYVVNLVKVIEGIEPFLDKHTDWDKSKFRKESARRRPGIQLLTAGARANETNKQEGFKKIIGFLKKEFFNRKNKHLEAKEKYSDYLNNKKNQNGHHAIRIIGLLLQRINQEFPEFFSDDERDHFKDLKSLSSYDDTAFLSHLQKWPSDSALGERVSDDVNNIRDLIDHAVEQLPNFYIYAAKLDLQEHRSDLSRPEGFSKKYKSPVKANTVFARLKALKIELDQLLTFDPEEKKKEDKNAEENNVHKIVSGLDNLNKRSAGDKLHYTRYIALLVRCIGIYLNISEDNPYMCVEVPASYLEWNSQEAEKIVAAFQKIPVQLADEVTVELKNAAAWCVSESEYEKYLLPLLTAHDAWCAAVDNFSNRRELFVREQQFFNAVNEVVRNAPPSERVAILEVLPVLTVFLQKPDRDKTKICDRALVAEKIASEMSKRKQQKTLDDRRLKDLPPAIEQIKEFFKIAKKDYNPSFDVLLEKLKKESTSLEGFKNNLENLFFELARKMPSQTSPALFQKNNDQQKVDLKDVINRINQEAEKHNEARVIGILWCYVYFLMNNENHPDLKNLRGFPLEQWNVVTPHLQGSQFVNLRYIFSMFVTIVPQQPDPVADVPALVLPPSAVQSKAKATGASVNVPAPVLESKKEAGIAAELEKLFPLSESRAKEMCEDIDEAIKNLPQFLKELFNQEDQDKLQSELSLYNNFFAKYKAEMGKKDFASLQARRAALISEINERVEKAFGKAAQIKGLLETLNTRDQPQHHYLRVLLLLLNYMYSQDIPNTKVVLPAGYLAFSKEKGLVKVFKACAPKVGEFNVRNKLAEVFKDRQNYICCFQAIVDDYEKWIEIIKKSKEISELNKQTILERARDFFKELNDVLRKMANDDERIIAINHLIKNNAFNFLLNNNTGLELAIYKARDKLFNIGEVVNRIVEDKRQSSEKLKLVIEVLKELQGGQLSTTFFGSSAVPKGLTATVSLYDEKADPQKLSGLIVASLKDFLCGHQNYLLRQNLIVKINESELELKAKQREIERLMFGSGPEMDVFTESTLSKVSKEASSLTTEIKQDQEKLEKDKSPTPFSKMEKLSSNSPLSYIVGSLLVYLSEPVSPAMQMQLDKWAHDYFESCDGNKYPKLYAMLNELHTLRTIREGKANAAGKKPGVK